MTEAVKELVRLVQENPDVDVICMTDTDVVGDALVRAVYEAGIL